MRRAKGCADTGACRTRSPSGPSPADQQRKILDDASQPREVVVEIACAISEQIGTALTSGPRARGARLHRDDAGAGQELREAAEALREADARYELAFVLTRWADLELARGHSREAARLATDALAVGRAIGRNSEVAIALVILAEAAHQEGKHAERDRHLKDLSQMDVATCSARCRSRVTAAMGAQLPPSTSLQ